MNELRIFNNPEFGVVRTVIIGGDVWFVGNDVARALGYEKYRDAVPRHVDADDRQGIQIEDAGQRRMVTVINESGLYSLIFGSQLESAKRFKRWVTSEVLPAIRKTGSYFIERKPDSYTIENPAERARRWAEEYEEKKQLEDKVTELEPKGKYFDAVCDARLLTNFRDAGKQLGMSQSQFTGYLKSNGYIYATNKGELRPTEPYRASGLFQMKSYVNRYSGFSGIRTYLTPKGVQYFKMQFESNEIIPEALPKHGGRRSTRK